VHYLEVPPSLFGPIVEQLGAAKLLRDGRVAVEKPFGRDLASARELDARLHRLLRESQILRDVVQNHLLQVLALVAMDPPAGASAGDTQGKKTEVLRAMPSADPQHCVRGQYQGYADVPGVASGSATETFLALRLQLSALAGQSWRTVHLDTSFAREDSVEETWRIVQPLLDHPPDVRPYPRGSWGPEEAETLLRGHPRWQRPWLPEEG
jgi:glucose-6-phosphate 1-dehydrogenase